MTVGVGRSIFGAHAFGVHSLYAFFVTFTRRRPRTALLIILSYSRTTRVCGSSAAIARAIYDLMLSTTALLQCVVRLFPGDCGLILDATKASFLPSLGAISAALASLSVQRCLSVANPLSHALSLSPPLSFSLPSSSLVVVMRKHQFISQFAEPGVMGELAQNSGLSALLGDDGMASVERDDVSVPYAVPHVYL